MSIEFVILSALLSLLAGIIVVLPTKNTRTVERISVLVTVLATVCGLAGPFFLFFFNEAPRRFSWLLFSQFQCVLGLDALSAIFLIPLNIVAVICSIYGLEYWPLGKHQQNGRIIRFFFGSAVAGMSLVLIARSAPVFLFGWELMALSAYFLVAAGSGQSEVRRAAWVYLVATHCGTLTLIGLFSYLYTLTGSFEFTTLPVATSNATPTIIVFVLALIGFGFKSGIMPFHVWLPSAHANAPSHVSALMSGVVIKMGVYGFIRMLSLLPAIPLWIGLIVLGLGLLSALLGILAAVNQSEIKRMLAYSSIENIGLIYCGLGIGIIGLVTGNGAVATLGFLGGLFHLVNHSFFKSLLFLSAGEIIHFTHVNRFDRLGGLAKKSPFLSHIFFIGVLAISGLPPLNGFFSEFLLYLGSLKLSILSSQALSSVGIIVFCIMAVTGAVALLCFVRAYSCVFAGSPRSSFAENEIPDFPLMHRCLASLALICLLLGAFAFVPIEFLTRVLDVFPSFGGMAKGTESAALILSVQKMIWLVSAGAVLLILIVLPKFRALLSRNVTWDCGALSAPGSRVQYTSASFVQLLLKYFRWGPKNSSQFATVSGAFPAQSHMRLVAREVILNELLTPCVRIVSRVFLQIRYVQQGKVQVYLGYIVIAFVVSLTLCLLLTGGA